MTCRTNETPTFICIFKGLSCKHLLCKLSNSNNKQWCEACYASPQCHFMSD